MKMGNEKKEKLEKNSMLHLIVIYTEWENIISSIELTSTNMRQTVMIFINLFGEFSNVAKKKKKNYCGKMIVHNQKH